MRITTLFFFLILIPFALVSAKDEVGIDTLVICPPKFQTSLKRWADYRTSQGHKILVEAPQATAAGIKNRIAALSATNQETLKNVFIVGDSGDRRSAPANLVKTDIIAAKVNVLFGSDPEIATDNTYADVDKDGLPDLTIARLPADSVEDIKQFTERVIAYEAKSNTGSWRRRVNCVAGVGGFGQMIDNLIENTTKQILTDLVPDGYGTSMTYGSWRSPYCPDPRQFSAESIERFNEGCMFWLYIGHGNRHWLDQVRMPDQHHTILDNDRVSRLNCRSGNPIAIFLSCYTGDCNHPVDCLAENMLKQENGPIGVICGTRITMPYAMSLLSLEMVHEFFNGEAKTLGELMRLAKIRMVTGSDNNPEYQQLIEGMGQAFSPKKNLLKQERLEHVHLIHLLGDPLLRLQRPDAIEINAPEKAVAGQAITVSGVVPASGKLVVELAYQRDRLKKRMKRRKEYDSSAESFASYQKTYSAARDLVCVSRELEVSAGIFETTIDVPSNSSGRCVVRAMLVAKDKFALGSSLIEIKKR